MDNRTKNILIAVLAVLGVGLFLVAASIVAFVMWLSSPTPLLENEIRGRSSTSSTASWSVGCGSSPIG